MEYVSNLFLLTAKEYPIVQMHHDIEPPVDEYWSFTGFGNYNQSYHEHLCISFCVDVFFSPLEYIIRSTTAGSYNNSVQHFEELFFKVPIPTYQERERAPVLTQP